MQGPMGTAKFAAEVPEDSWVLTRMVHHFCTQLQIACNPGSSSSERLGLEQSDVSTVVSLKLFCAALHTANTQLTAGPW